MALAEFEVERIAVPFGKEVAGKRKSLSVRGITVTDLTPMVTSRLGDLEQLYALFQESKKSIYSTNSVSRFLTSVVAKMPDLTAEVISVACDEPEHKDKAAALPLAVQIAAISTILKLTLEEAGGLKNLYGMLVNLTEELLPESVRAELASQMVKIKAAAAGEESTAK